eukprot:355050-Chlamydomonas_euryale.AAC.3
MRVHGAASCVNVQLRPRRRCVWEGGGGGRGRKAPLLAEPHASKRTLLKLHLHAPRPFAPPPHTPLSASSKATQVYFLGSSACPGAYSDVVSRVPSSES